MLRSNIKDVYLKSRFYIVLSAIQILFSLALILYVLTDLKSNYRKPWLLGAELVLGGMMLVDAMIYSVATGCKLTCLLVSDWALITTYLAVYSFLIFSAVSLVTEEIEVGLMAVRVVLQAMRVGLGLVRAKDVKEKREAVEALEIHMDSAAKDSDGEGRPTTVDI